MPKMNIEPFQHCIENEGVAQITPNEFIQLWNQLKMAITGSIRTQNQWRYASIVGFNSSFLFLPNRFPETIWSTT